MAVRFLLGPAGSGKTHYCLEALRDLEREGRAGVYLVPEQFTYSADRELLDVPDLAGLRHVRIFSFSRLAFWLRERAGVAGPETIDEAVRPMILRAVVERMPPEELGPISTLKRRPGVLQQLSRFVGEVRNHGPQSLLDGIRRARTAPGAPAGLPAGALEKLEALAAVYEAYAATLKNLGRRDPEERLFGLEPILVSLRDALADLPLYVDGFMSWTRREREVLVALASAGARIEVSLCCDPPGPGDDGGARVPFRPVLRSLDELDAALRRAGVAVEPPMRFPATNPTRFRSAELRVLERGLYAPGSGGDDTGRTDSKSPVSPEPAATRPEPSPPVSLQPARDRRQEVVLWARRIDHWTRLDPEPVERHEIALVLRDVEPYRELIQEIFRRYEIPFFLDERRSVLSHPRARLLLGALEVLLSNWRRDAVIAILRNPLLRIRPPLVDLLENRSLAYGWDFEAWHDPEPWERYYLPPRSRPTRPAATGDAPPGSDDDQETEGEEPADDDAEVARAAEPPEPDGTDDVRRSLLLPLRDLERSWMSGQWTGAEAVTGLRRLLAAWTDEPVAPAHRHLFLETLPEEAARHGGLDPEWSATVGTRLNELLEEMASLWGEVPVSIDELTRTLREGIASLRIGVTPVRLDQVLVADVQRSRLHGIRRVILGGVNEGTFPRTVSDDPVLNDRDREILEALGAPLGPTARERQEEEAYLFYIGLTRASEQALITWAAMDGLGKPLPPSLLLEEITRVVPGAAPVSIPPDPEAMPPEEIQTAPELGTRLLAFFAAQAAGSDGARMEPSLHSALIETYNRILALVHRPKAPDVPAPGVSPEVPPEASGESSPGASAEVPPGGSPRVSPTIPPGVTAGVSAEVSAGSPPRGAREAAAGVSPEASAEASPIRAASAAVLREIQRGLPPLLYKAEPRIPESLLPLVYPGRQLVSSVSRLQGFAACPYRSFAEKVLRLEPRPVAQVTPLETGILAHAALERFFQSPTGADRGKVEARVEAVFRALAGQPEFHAFQVDEASRYRWHSTKNALMRYLYLETDRLKNAQYQVQGQEVAFGPEDGKPVSLPLPDGRDLLLQGRIDRVDILDDEAPGSGKKGLVLDYKRSARHGLPRKLEQGLDLQLAAYLLYLRDVLHWRPSGGLYVPVLPSPPREETLKEATRNPLGLKMHGIFLAEERDAIDGGTDMLVKSRGQLVESDEAMNRLLEIASAYLTAYAASQCGGWIRPVPLESEPGKLPCDHCDFGAVCRFRRGVDPVRRSPVEGMLRREGEVAAP
jgi:ATP-dependent helicase/DNAse subunit B